ncbi:hypothetical protein ZIOFF_021536 [Zingiber officinale]|uniref:Uncharacterized protein n=1 Tax=Zingiber officinale TaxID=94328 RepID=A0A8J5LM47_ZINOF|nr:hypothetical protein ZIOFF_021536 [Zingiber officinale]
MYKEVNLLWQVPKTRKKNYIPSNHNLLQQDTPSRAAPFATKLVPPVSGIVRVFEGKGGQKVTKIADIVEDDDYLLLRCRSEGTEKKEENPLHPILTDDYLIASDHDEGSKHSYEADEKVQIVEDDVNDDDGSFAPSFSWKKLYLFTGSRFLMRIGFLDLGNLEENLQHGYWVTSGRAVPGRVPTLGTIGALVHGGDGHDWGRHPGGDRECYCDQDIKSGHASTLCRSSYDDHGLRSVAKDMIRDGKRLASKSRCPLMYEWNSERYWGDGHGLTGIMHALMGVNLHEDDLKYVKGTLNYMINNRFISGNYPSIEGFNADCLVPWCHGAPSVALTLTKAAQIRE